MARVTQTHRIVSSQDKSLPRKAAAVLNEVSSLAVAEAPLALVTKLGARVMLQVALEEEVMAFLHRDWYERRSISAPPGWRNGAKPRTVKVAGGDLTIPMP